MPSTAELGDVFGALVRHDVDFVLVGAVAGWAWGSPALEDDVAVVVDLDDDNVDRLASAIPEFDPARLRRSGNVRLTMPNGEVSVLGRPPGVDHYAELAPNAVVMELLGHSVPVAAIDDLLRLELASARPQDRIAAEWLAALRDERGRQGRYEP